MSMKKIFIFMAFLLSVAVHAWAQDDDAKYASELLKPGTAAPDFTLNDMAGKSHSLSSLKGEYVLLDFWASWCSDCRKDIPEMKRLHELYGEKVRFVGISFDDKKENWEKCVEANGIGWLQLSELRKWKETDISKFYQIHWIPSMYLIDPEGNIVLGTVMIGKVAEKLKELNEK